MKEICENIYKKSRKSAGLEQIDAADKLGVSARSLQNYESEINQTLPPLDIVRNMCIIYKDKSLAYKHIKKSPIGEFIPDFSAQPSLTIATLSMLDDFNKMQGLIAKIIEVTKDDYIDESEANDWQEFCKIGNNLLESLNSLINAKGAGVSVD